jgi:hypothetical protein
MKALTKAVVKVELLVEQLDQILAEMMVYSTE